MNMDVVSIVDDVHDCNISNSYYTVYWNSGKSGKNKVSINEYVQGNSISIRGKYVAFINQFRVFEDFDIFGHRSHSQIKTFCQLANRF